MIVADMLEAMRRLPVGTLEDLTDGAPFLVLAPHSDDETLGCGGLLSLTAAAGTGRILILTDGAGSHPASRTFPPERLVRLRQDESVAALRRLGLAGDEVTFLGWPDTQLPAAGPRFDEIVESVVRAVRGSGAETLFVTWGHDPHCDHEAADRIARAAAERLAPMRLWAYPAWGWHLDPDAAIDAEPPIGWRLAIDSVHDRKREALECYASQMSPLIDDDPSGFRFTEAQLAPFLGRFETFVAVSP